MNKSLRKLRLYGLFEMQEGKWVRLYPTAAYFRPDAVRIFQDLLLHGAMTGIQRRLRMVRN